MSKAQNSSILKWTTGAGIAIGTNAQAAISGVIVGSVPTKVTIKANGTTAFEIDSNSNHLTYPVPLDVPTATSSGGSFAILYQDL